MKTALFLAAMLAASPLWAADAARGAQKAQVCFTCHGPQGATPIAPDYPVIAGQHETYLVRALLDYKTGARKNPVMSGQAGALSRQDIEDLSAYFSQQKSALHTKK